jgi:2-polyprenyl-3-methyl-5-hydroxy-6-metoxy-1,4-benzoquinol methylase
MALVYRRAKGVWYSSPHMSTEATEGALIKNRVRTFYNEYPMSNFGILQKLELPKQIRGKKVLDAGCGSGFFLFDYLFYGAEVTGIDQSEKSIEFIRTQAQILDLSPVLMAGDLETVELPPDSFDYIFSTYVIHHTPDPVAVLKNFRNWCKKGGTIRLIISHKHNLETYLQKYLIAPLFYIFPFLTYLIPTNIKKRVHFEDRFEHPYWKQMSLAEAERHCLDAGLEIKVSKVYGFSTFLLGYLIPPIINKGLDVLLGKYLGRAILIEATPKK